MFEPASIIKYRFVQRNTNKTVTQSFIYEYIYCFLLRTEHSCSKYVVILKEYRNGLLTVDFYRKIKSDKRFKLLSNNYKFGRVGATVLDIMRDVQNKTGLNTFGIVASTMLNEDNDESNKRYKVYIEILRRKIDKDKYKVFGTDQNSFIFVIPNNRIVDNKQIFLDYGKVFTETN